MVMRRQFHLLSFAVFVTFIIFLYQYSHYELAKSVQPPYIRPSPRPDTFNWAERKQTYPVQEMIRLPPGLPISIPKIQRQLSWRDSRRKALEQRRQAVKETFLHSWKGYKKHAWLIDEVTPVDGGSKTSFGWATTMVDSLDSLWIMGEKAEFEEGVRALSKIDFTNIEAETRSLFETTIRHFGGLLSAYDVSEGQYPEILDAAVVLGDMLYAAFDTPNRMPVNWWNWKLATEPGQVQSASTGTSLAELGSLSLEFTRLTQLTQDPKYFDAVQRVTDALEAAQNETKLPGMWPVVVDARNLLFNQRERFSLGALSDSAYEYLPKEYMLLGGSHQYRKMYELSLDVMKRHLFFRPMLPNQNVLISGNADVREDGSVTTDTEAQHLACFTGGMVDIAAKIFNRPEDADTAKRLVDGCIWAYNLTKSGIMPESFHIQSCDDTEACEWDESRWSASRSDESLPPGVTQWNDKRYLLRPEAIESVFIHYRITGDRTYQDKAWEMFQAIEKHTRTEIASSAIRDVTSDTPEKLNEMESFWLGETLKYFYLIFSEPDLISLDDYVFNTEAHPLLRPK